MKGQYNDGTVIAIKKRIRKSIARLPFDEKIDKIVFDAEQSKRVDQLLEWGFEQIDFKDDLNKDQTLDERERGLDDDTQFQRLGRIGAYIFQSKDENDTKKFKDLLGKDYEFYPNFKLNLPASMKTEIRGEKFNPNNRWPEISGVLDAHREGIKGQDVLVAVLDTGCDADHVQFSEQSIDFRYVNPSNSRRLRKVRGFDTDGHGTHVTGIIAGKATGIAPHVSLKVVSVIESETAQTTMARLLTGLEWFAAKYLTEGNEYTSALINLSLGIPSEIMNKMNSINLLIETLENTLRTFLYEFDILSVVAIGNDGSGNMRFPGMSKDVLSVGAVDKDGNPATFSGGGKIGRRFEPNIVGYGVDVYSALERTRENRNIYAIKSGTSMAAPYVTGIAALYSQKTGLKGKDLRDLLLKTVQPLSHPKNRVGAGLARYLPNV